MSEMNLLRCRDYLEHCVSIRTKAGTLVRLKLNPAQERLYQAIQEERAAGRPVRIIVLKARQMGFSTLIESIGFWACATKELTREMVVAHKADATRNLFAMNRTMLQELPEPVRPMTRASNAQEIIFENPSKDKRKVARAPGLRSSITCATAGGSGVGRSETLRVLHLSEFAFWPGEKIKTLGGIMAAMAQDAGTMAFIETTANGYDAFRDLWMQSVEAWERGERTGWRPFFAAWWEMPDYRRAYDGFTPTVRERELQELYKLDMEQLAWRRWAIATICAGDEDMFAQEYPATPEEAFLASGRCIFPLSTLKHRIPEARAEGWVKRGRFVYSYDDARPRGEKLYDIRWEDDQDGGELIIYQEPRQGYPYVIGGDTAGDGSDWFVGQGIDNSSGEQVCTLRHRYDEDVYARQMYCLGRYYNWALLGIEKNFSTFPNKELARLGYPKLYVTERLDSYTGKTAQAWGFKTDQLTRPIIVAGLVGIVRDHSECIRDVTTLTEMTTFVRGEDGKPEAEEGKHDDCVLAMAIAYQVRSQQSTKRPKAAQQKKVKWTKDMHDDYKKAGKEAKAYLLEKWGNPF